VLGLDTVGIDESFFDLGGDSIGSIVLVSRARKNGLRLNPKQVFQKKTVAELAACAASASESQHQYDDGTGTVPATPIIRWWLEQGAPVEAFRQSMLISLPSEVDEKHLIGALQVILDRHAALRAALTPDGGFLIGPTGSIDAKSCIRRIPIDSPQSSESLTTIRREAQAADLRLAPFDGRMIEVVWFDAPDKQPGCLLLSVHHVVMDGVSWRIVIPELATAYQSLRDGAPLSPSPATTSLRHWATLLQAEARSPHRKSELPLWTDGANTKDPLLSPRKLDPLRDTTNRAGSLTLALSTDTTQALLTRIPADLHGTVNDVLLGTFAVAIICWRRRYGLADSSPVRIDLEAHGREHIFDDVDLTHTVGWFTSMFPIAIQMADIDLDSASACSPDLVRAIQRMAQHLERLPDHGIGYGLLRYLNEETATELATPSPQISFNYLGRFASASGGPWSPLGSFDTEGSVDRPLTHPLSINAITHDYSAGPRFSATWTWASDLFTEDDVRDLATAWFSMLDSLAKTQFTLGPAPSDYPLVHLSQAIIDDMVAKHGMPRDVLPLSPLQQGFLFHMLYDEDAMDVYHVQMRFVLRGRLDADILRAAAGAILDRHEHLRAAFLHEGVDEPIQWIADSIEPEWTDLTAQLDDPASKAGIDKYLNDDMCRRFDPARPPLVRFTLIQYAGDHHELIITVHHILLDGWSVPIVFQELIAAYRAGGHARALPPVTPYREFLAWIHRQEKEVSHTEWIRYLAEFEEPTLLFPGALPTSSFPETYTVELSPETYKGIVRMGRHLGTTLSNIALVAWGLLLRHLTGRDDVMFGVTVSGRSPDLPSVERMVGLFINTLPCRARFLAGESLGGLIQRTQEEQAGLMDHQHVGLSYIQAAAGHDVLFDTHLVVENFPHGDAAPADEVNAVSAGLVGGTGGDVTHYPLSVAVLPGESLGLRFSYVADVVDADRVRIIAEKFVKVFEIIARADTTRAAIVDLLDDHERQTIVHAWNDTARPIPMTTVVASFEDRAAYVPDAIAVVSGDRKLTYAELDARANRLARRLVQEGAGPDVIIGIALPRSLELVTAQLAVLKSGAAFLPLDPTYPIERLTFMLNDAKPHCVVITQNVASLLPRGTRCLVIEEASPLAIESNDSRGPRDRGSPLLSASNHLAYVIYTSGSTGTPKGVQITQAGFINHVHRSVTAYYTGKGKGSPTMLSASFDGHITAWFGTLLAGETLTLLPERQELELLSGDVASQTGYSLMKMTPSQLRVLNDLGYAPSCDILMLGGEAMLYADIAPWRNRTPNIRIVNQYGPTEASVASCTFEVPLGIAPGDDERLPIGKPVANTQVFVLDTFLQPVPVGVPGELYIGGT
ncbi:condensation domain-containing protein, partial [Luteibacter sp. ME-Dv--P-043b]|uniref:condensation domain-containing protein n=1 Tax=Luteibacter sp. ME-Dv--P-043b TaxID=3040291 RepID=UPI0025546587